MPRAILASLSQFMVVVLHRLVNFAYVLGVITVWWGTPETNRFSKNNHSKVQWALIQE